MPCIAVDGENPQFAEKHMGDGAAFVQKPLVGGIQADVQLFDAP